MNMDPRPDLPPAHGPQPAASIPVPVSMSCPQCGSRRLRKRSRPLVLNVIACLVFLLASPLVGVMFLAFLLALLALPITMAIALVGRHRCLDCHHRFDPESWDADFASGFPWRYYVLNLLALVLLCDIGPYLIALRSAGGLAPDILQGLNLFTVLGFFLWVSLAWHVLVYRKFRRRIVNPLLWGLLFVLPALLGGTAVLYGSLPQVRAAGLLWQADLAPLPPSATVVRVYSWSFLFAGEDLLCFTASPADIERFLTESPALQGQEPTRFSARKMRLPYPTKEYLETRDPATDANEYFSPRHRPSWYKQEIRGPARKYLVQPPDYQFPGEVLIDDETNTVYVYLCFS